MQTEPETSIILRTPTPDDGASVFNLISQCPPLDTNSMYCNLIQCSHFANTSAAAVINEKLMGFISGYLIPQRPDTLFIWQVAVGEQARGRGLATKMLLHILERNNVNYLETTITKSNRASWALFEGMAKKLNADIQTSVMFDQELHFANQHDTEMLVKLGPFKLTSS